MQPQRFPLPRGEGGLRGLGFSSSRTEYDSYHEMASRQHVMSRLLLTPNPAKKPTPVREGGRLPPGLRAGAG
jgi:hypothetical protein